jgi:4-carboxymuconolactone decarboxylase
MASTDGEQTYRDVMVTDRSTPNTPFGQATRDFLFGQVWSRPGLSRRDRRLVTLACVAAADSPGPIDRHVYAALKSGDLDLEALLETVLQFAVYCGWPKASHLEGVITELFFRIFYVRL